MKKHLVVTSLMWLTALALLIPARAEAQSPTVKQLLARVAALEATVAALQAKLACVSVDDSPINGLAGPQFTFEGCNVHVRSGSGSTDDGGALTGLGNLVVGYNEPRSSRGGFDLTGRTGSHNLIVGHSHKYPSFGGFVAGNRNTVSGPESSVSGGGSNTASGHFSSVSGGESNTASGGTSSVSGGMNNTASGGQASSVSGGLSNTASGNFSSVSGGGSDFFMVGGNVASGDLSSVSGGLGNTASGEEASVSGGNNRSATGQFDWAAGTLFETE